MVDEVTAVLDEDSARQIRQLLYSLSVTVIEVAHHIDDEAVYDQVLDLAEYQ